MLPDEIIYKILCYNPGQLSTYMHVCSQWRNVAAGIIRDNINRYIKSNLINYEAIKTISKINADIIIEIVRTEYPENEHYILSAIDSGLLYSHRIGIYLYKKHGGYAPLGTFKISRLSNKDRQLAHLSHGSNEINIGPLPKIECKVS